MNINLYDRNTLLDVSPTALSAYARTAGWEKHGTYRTHSDIYVGEDLPEIIIPRTEHLGDYASVVARLIKSFARAGHQEETSVYRSLVTTDRDAIRLRVGESEEGSVKLNRGVNLIQGARDMLLAIACSLDKSKGVYRVGPKATEIVSGFRLGQTDRGCFVVTILTTVIPPPIPSLFPDQPDPDAPAERRLTTRLMEALTVVRTAAEQTASGDEDAFRDATKSGVSANLCEALDKILSSFSTLDVCVSWAQIRPNTRPNRTIRFGVKDAPLLQHVAQIFREHAPQPDIELPGHVQLLKRRENEEDGTIRLNTFVDEKQHLVTALLERQDYEQAVQAHRDKAMVVLSGDLERTGQRWRLWNPSLKRVLSQEEADLDN